LIECAPQIFDIDPDQWCTPSCRSMIQYGSVPNSWNPSGAQRGKIWCVEDVFMFCGSPSDVISNVVNGSRPKSEYVQP
jgi:hypothetical protein